MSAFHPEYQAREDVESIPTKNYNNLSNNIPTTQVASSEQQQNSTVNSNNSNSNNNNNNNSLHELQNTIEQQNLQINQLKSEVEFHRTTASNLQKNTDELNKLRHQEALHADTLKVLVTEKSSLMDTLQKTEVQIKELKSENEELHNRLNVSRHRVKQLEIQQVQQQQQHPSMNNKEEIDTKKLEQLVEERVKEWKDLNSKLELERNEFKLLLGQQKIEMENLQKNFDHINTELHLATIKIAQLSDDTQHQQSQPENTDVAQQSQFNVLNQEIAIKQQQINELNSIIDQLSNERDANETQYQNYVSAMSGEMKELKEKSLELENENNSLVKREQELLKHVNDLERQMQHQIQKQKIFAEQSAVSSTMAADTDTMASQIANLTNENESLKAHLEESEKAKQSLMKSLEEKTEEIQGLEFQVDKMRTITPNMTQLMSDFEDKSTAASRALTQNNSLKAQLEELQRAFVNISNDKMELTDKLQSEMHLCKEMKHQYESMDKELKTMKENWQFKEDEMIRLSRENTEFQKTILQQNIEIDRLRHYESKDYHGSSGIVQDELEHCKHLIESLTNKINILESGDRKHSHDDHSHDSHGHSHSHDGHGHSHSHEGHSHNHESPVKKKSCEPSNKHLLEEIEMLKMEKNELIKAINDFQMNKKSSVDTQKDDGETENKPEENGGFEEMTDEKMQKMSVTPSIATEEALEKLQSRFRRTMLEVAELTEEKQRLEHVVTQLQFETETIGEYITLYQNQRRLLKQKEHERDIQLKNLAADREMMNEKLCQLNGLIEKFVLQHSDGQHMEIAKEATKFLDNNASEQAIINPDNNNQLDFEKLKKETAGKILEILSDIKTTNTRTYGNAVGVENCACCYGELKTV